MFKPSINAGECLQVQCNQCIGCRLQYSRGWAIRAVHEKQFHDESEFMTLTYRDANLPYAGSLNKKHLSAFYKRLRRHLDYHHNGKKIRHFSCGEYGDTTQRPHYHGILFGHIFPDRKFHSQTKLGHRLYTSKTLDRIWSHGHCYLGAVTYQSAAYVARYITKKIKGKDRNNRYLGGVLKREFLLPSTGKGIGHPWIEKYWKDVFPDGGVVIDGRRMPPPDFYWKWLEVNQSAAYEEAKERRKEFIETLEEIPGNRLETMEKCRLIAASRLERPEI